MDEIRFRLFIAVSYLLLRKSVDFESFTLDMRTVPHAALFVKAIRRIRQIQSPHRHDGMFVRLCSRGFDVDN